MELFSKGSLQDLSAMQVNRAIMGLAMRYNMQLPNELVLIARAIAISEGTGMMLYPGLRMIEYAVPYVRNSWMAEQSIDNLFPRIRQTTIDGVELGVELPRRLTHLLGQLERCQLEFIINVDRIRELLPVLQHMTNRLAIAILLAGTIVALGLVMVVYQPAQWQRLGEIIFAFALVVSFSFGLWLVWGMIRGR